MSHRAAIYGRYSSDNQRSSSIDDQVRVCRGKCERADLVVTKVYADYAVSGTTDQRSAYRELLADAQAGRYDVVVAESLDRISRDQEHIAAFYKQVTFLGIRILTVAEDEISEIHVGLKGTMGALYIKDLAQKTRRGLEGRVRAGRSAGGLSYGYRLLDRRNADGDRIRGERAIDEAEAAIVRRIFSDYVGGMSPRMIARMLNSESVPGARGGGWTASMILGNAIRETGILRNRLYAGEIVWNRQKFLKDPLSGKRVARPNPRDQWVTEAAESLRIIDENVWAAAQARLAEARRTVVGPDPQVDEGGAVHSGNRGARLTAVRRPVWLLAGLVRCGVCDGPMSVVGTGGRLGCANHRERDTCTNKRTILRDRLVTLVLAGLRERLLAPELVEVFVRDYIAEVNAANRDRERLQAKLDQEHARVRRQLRNLVDLIKEGGGSRVVLDEIRQLEMRQEELVAEMAARRTPEPVPALHPNMAAIYRAEVEALHASLDDPATSAKASAALRSLIDGILVFPGPRRGETEVHLRGDLAAFMRLPQVDGCEGATAGAARNKGSGEVVGSLVAGARNHLDLLLTG